MHRFHFHFGRHHGGRGLGRFGRGFFEGGDGRSFGMGRKLSSVDLQLIILALLNDKPSHGYEIIRALDERSQGFYVPSPGMVYPALTYLEEIGHADVEADGTRKLYHITAAGREHLTANRARADALLAQFAQVGERMGRVRRAVRAHEDSSPEYSAGGSKELDRARLELKRALADKWSSQPEEQQRIVAILERAAADIRGKAPAN